MKYLITYRDLVDGTEKILMVIYSEYRLTIEKEWENEIKNDMVQHNNSSTSGSK